MPAALAVLVVAAVLAWGLRGPGRVPAAAGVTWAVDVYRGGRWDRGVRLTDAPSPVFNGDKLQVHVHISESSYAYLFWIGSDGQVARIYPEEAARPEAVTDLRVPASEHRGLRVLGPPGTEVCVLVLRRWPCEDLGELLKRLHLPGLPPPLRCDLAVVDGDLLQGKPRSGEGGTKEATGPAQGTPQAERPRGVGNAELLEGLAVVEFLGRWHHSLPHELGEVHYVALPHLEPAD